MTISNKEIKRIKIRNKKLDSFINEKKAIIEISDNLNSVITNLSSWTLNNKNTKF